MRRPVFLLASLTLLACPGTAAAPLRTPVPPVQTASETLRPAWDRPFDTEAGLLVVGDRIVVSDGNFIVFHDLADGHETARAPRTEAFRSWIDEPHDPVLFDVGAFVLASGREHVLARFDLDARAPAWTSRACRRPYAAARLGTNVAVLCDAELLVLEPDAGDVMRVLPIAATSFMDEHAIVEVNGGIVVRSGDALVGLSDDGTERFRSSAGGSFGLAASGEGFVIVSPSEGLIELDAVRGTRLRVIAIPRLVAYPDPLDSSLGSVRVDDDVALVEAGGLVRAVPLAEGAPSWASAGAGAIAMGDAVYVCAGVRAVALDRTTGTERWSWSVGGCETTAASRERVLFRHESVGPYVVQADVVYEGVLAFVPGETPVPCEEVTLRGVVRIGGAPAAGIHVRAGVAWSVTRSGAIAGWGSRVLPEPGARGPSDARETDASGSYRLHFCDRGHVPVVVDHADVERASGEPEAAGTVTYLHLDGRGEYTVDFEVRPHGPEL